MRPEFSTYNALGINDFFSCSFIGDISEVYVYIHVEKLRRFIPSKI